MSKKEDLTGQRFGRLVITGEGSPAKAYRTRWAYVCDCGTIGETMAASLKKGDTKSCGCWHVEKSRMIGFGRVRYLKRYPVEDMMADFDSMGDVG